MTTQTHMTKQKMPLDPSQETALKDTHSQESSPHYQGHLAGLEKFMGQQLCLSPKENLAYIRRLQEWAFEEKNLPAVIRLQEMFLKVGKDYLSKVPAAEDLVDHLLSMAPDEYDRYEKLLQEQQAAQKAAAATQAWKKEEHRKAVAHYKEMPQPDYDEEYAEIDAQKACWEDEEEAWFHKQQMEHKSLTPPEKTPLKAIQKGSKRFFLPKKHRQEMLKNSASKSHFHDNQYLRKQKTRRPYADTPYHQRQHKSFFGAAGFLKLRRP